MKRRKRKRERESLSTLLWRIIIESCLRALLYSIKKPCFVHHVIHFALLPKSFDAFDCLKVILQMMRQMNCSEWREELAEKIRKAEITSLQDLP